MQRNNPLDQQYLDIMEEILYRGEWKQPTRKNYHTGKEELLKGGKNLCSFGHSIRHDMRNGFPLLTSKSMKSNFNIAAAELCGFIRGETSKQYYQNLGCNIWNEWANPKVVKEIMDQLCTSPEFESQIKERVDDLGPIYGYQWRYWSTDRIAVKSIDQLGEVLIRLRTNPHDRRMVVSAWNPSDFANMGLVPCHMLFVVCVVGGKLNLEWIQRSCDWPLGVPFNIASYGMLLCLLAAWADLEPGILKGDFVDCHVYENQIDIAKKQLARQTYALPKMVLRPDLKKHWRERDYGFMYFSPVPDWFDLVEYNNAGALRYPKPVV